jgi:hypothetical protein
MAMVCEVIKDLLELDQKSEIVFVKRSDSPYIYAIGFTPDGQKVACELPTAIERPKEKKKDE